MKRLFRRSPVRLQAASLLLVIGMTSVVLAADYPAPGDFAAGAKQWAANCGRCHTVRDPRDLRDDQWITTAFHMRLRAGLTGEETRNILTFLEQSNTVTVAVVNSASTTSGPEAVNAKSEAEIYAGTCVACHGADGKGTLPGAPNFGDSAGPLSKTDEVLHKHILEGFQTTGSPMAMPPKGGNAALTDTEIDLLLEYLRSTFGQ